MTRRPTRLRALALGAAALVVLAGCAGGPEPDPAAPESPDLFQALPTPTTVAPTPAPTTTAAPPTTTKKPPTTSKKPKKTDGPSRVAASAPTGPWKQIAADEFDGGSLDKGTWKPYSSKGAFGTGYRKPEAITQSDGTLKITARGDVSGGMAHTVGQLYGRWEFRARTSPGRGFGSVILLWPDSEKWPDDGEINIMEVPGENRDLAHFVLHMGPENRLLGTNMGGDFTKWHTFAVEWLPDRITWFVDGVKQWETTDKNMIPTKPMHAAIQLDQGPYKDWIKPRDETTPPEVSLEVDWIRVSKL